MKKKLEDFPWSDHELETPKLEDFCLWIRNLCKGVKGGLYQDIKKKIKKRYKPDIDSEMIHYIKCNVSAICGGRIYDSFLNSPKFWELKNEIKNKYGISISTSDYAGIIVSERKKTFSKEVGKIYFGYTRPISSPKEVKIGFTKGDPYDRLNAVMGQAKTESVELIGWIQGTLRQEKKIQNKFKKYNIKGFSSKEMFKFDEFFDVKDVINTMEEITGNKFRKEKLEKPEKNDFHLKKVSENRIIQVSSD